MSWVTVDPASAPARSEPPLPKPMNCNYGVNPHYSTLLDQARGLRIGAAEASGAIRAVELDAHPFFLATLFQPERSALRDLDHPLITAFVRAAADNGGPGRAEQSAKSESFPGHRCL